MSQGCWFWTACTRVKVRCVTQMTLRHEDGDSESQLPPSGRKDRRRASVGVVNERRGLERRRSRRHSLQNSRGPASAPASPSSPASSFLPFTGQRVEDISERWGGGDTLEENKSDVPKIPLVVIVLVLYWSLKKKLVILFLERCKNLILKVKRYLFKKKKIFSVFQEK